MSKPTTFRLALKEIKNENQVFYQAMNTTRVSTENTNSSKFINTRKFRNKPKLMFETFEDFNKPPRG